MAIVARPLGLFGLVVGQLASKAEDDKAAPLAARRTGRAARALGIASGDGGGGGGAGGKAEAPMRLVVYGAASAPKFTTLSPPQGRLGRPAAPPPGQSAAASIAASNAEGAAIAAASQWALPKWAAVQYGATSNRTRRCSRRCSPFQDPSLSTTCTSGTRAVTDTRAVGGNAVGSGARPQLGCSLAELAISMHALSRLPSARGAAAPPELVAISARLVEHIKREVGEGRRQAEFAGSEGLYGSAAIDAWMRDPQHCRDVAMLCNGAVQLGVQLPPMLVQHLQQLIRAVPSAGPEEAARMSSQAQPDRAVPSAQPERSGRRATRRMRNELRELADSLSRLDADLDAPAVAS